MKSVFAVAAIATLIASPAFAQSAFDALQAKSNRIA